MRRRDVLGAVGGAALSGLAGCAGVFETRSARVPPLVENRPDAVYVPTHYEGMNMQGMQKRRGYACALTYSYPHRFWLPKPNGMTKVSVAGDDSVHLMPLVWDVETGIIPPDLTPQVTVTRDGESVDQLSPWPMLSQPMGVHFGDNVQLDGEGTYAVDVRIGTPSARRTGALADNEGGASFAFDFEFSRSELEAIPYTDVPADEQGTRGAVPPMDMEMLPNSQAPVAEDLPGDVRATATSGDAQFVVTVLDDATPVGGGESDSYLAVSARTPYNRYVLPMMSLSGTLTRGTETVFDGFLRATVDPDLDYHYGAVVPGVESGDEFTVAIDAPPQTARHEGYETAFVEMPEVRTTL